MDAKPLIKSRLQEFLGFESIRGNGLRVPIATKLIASFLLIILLISAIFTIVGVQLINDRIIAEAEERVRFDMDFARESYLEELNRVNDVIRATANNPSLVEAIESGNIESVKYDLVGARLRGGLHILSIADKDGNVLIRTQNQGLKGDNISQDDLIQAVQIRKIAVAATSIIPAANLIKESPFLAKDVIDNDHRTIDEAGPINTGLMMKAAAPIFDSQKKIAGFVYGGVILNNNLGITCSITQSIFRNAKYDGQPIGAVAIYRDDVGISACDPNDNSHDFFGIISSKEVTDKVLLQEKTWTGRTFFLDRWHISTFEPIRNVNHKPVGMLYVGILEQKYIDIRTDTTVAFLAITLTGVILSLVTAYFISKRITVPLKRLVFASREIAKGGLDVRVNNHSLSNDELGELAAGFNSMACALQERDEQLKEFTKSKIMQSERLALVGQLSANVAHELNNPLTGIISYSHLLLERTPPDHRDYKFLQKIVTQANRSKDIIRGLLDFSRQRQPNKSLNNVNRVLEQSISLVENQAAFMNIRFVKIFDAELPPTIIDSSQVERVFINLFINAAEAMDFRGEIYIETIKKPLEDFIEIIIQDTGHGIAAENLDKIFDPFFTTKEVGHGTGLGLAISYGIITKHNGNICVESKEGKGTKFIIRFPVAEKNGVSDG